MELSSHPVSADGDIRVQKLSHAVADRLRDQIITGQRKPGENLPLESELVVQFKVSRPTIREALRVLEVESLISLGRGARSGATVLGPTVERAAEYAAMVLASAGTTIGELNDARTQIEPSMLLLIAKKRDPKLFDELQACVDAGIQAVSEKDHTLVRAALSRFHGVLVRGSDNRALILMVQMLVAMQNHPQSVVETMEAEEEKQLFSQFGKALQSYQELVVLLRHNKGKEAQLHWRKYLEQTQEFLEKSGIGKRRLKHS